MGSGSLRSLLGLRRTPQPATPTRCALFTRWGAKAATPSASQAFLQSTPFLPHEVMYPYPPSGHRHNGNHVWGVLKSVYGLGVLPVRRRATLSSFLLEHGWREAGDEDTFWIYERGDVLMRAVL